MAATSSREVWYGQFDPVRKHIRFSAQETSLKGKQVVGIKMLQSDSNQRIARFAVRIVDSQQVEELMRLDVATENIERLAESSAAEPAEIRSVLRFLHRYPEGIDVTEE